MVDMITDNELERFARGAASQRERLEIVTHLLRGCSSCIPRLRDLTLPQAQPPGAYDAVFGRLEGFLPDTMDPDDPFSLSFLVDVPSRLPPEEPGATRRH